MFNKLLKQYVISFFYSTCIFLTLSIYLYLRRGYFDLYIANKALAGGSFIILCIVLLLGALSRLYQIFDRFIIYRKELGVMSFLFAFIHGIVSLFALPSHFPLAKYITFPITFIGGLSSLILLTVLFIASFEFVITRMNKTVWWHLQNWGVRIAGLLIFLHVIPMKYANWLKWFKIGGGDELLRPYLPPAGLLVISLGLLVLTIRIIDRITTRYSRLLISAVILIYTLALGLTFGIGLGNSPKPLPLTWDTCIKLPGSIIRESYPSVCVGTGGRTAIQPIK